MFEFREIPGNHGDIKAWKNRFLGFTIKQKVKSRFNALHWCIGNVKNIIVCVVRHCDTVMRFPVVFHYYHLEYQRVHCIVLYNLNHVFSPTV